MNSVGQSWEMEMKDECGRKEHWIPLLCHCLISCTTIPSRVLWCSGPVSRFHLGRGIKDKIICLSAESLKEITGRSKEDMLNHQKRKERKENSHHKVETKVYGWEWWASPWDPLDHPETLLSSSGIFHCGTWPLQRQALESLTVQVTDEKSFH